MSNQPAAAAPKKNKMTGNYFYKTSVFRTVAVIAACLALIVGVVFTVPVFFDSGNNSSYENNNRHEEAVPPWLREEEHHITIDSIDMLNYYTAMKALADPARPFAQRQKLTRER